MASNQAVESPQPPVSLAQTCYDVAYFVLPHYAFHDVAKVTDMCLKSPKAAGPFFYLMARTWRKVEPDLDDAERFRWHLGAIDSQRDYFVLEYPPSPPVDLSKAVPEHVVQGALFVLAPYYSAIVIDKATGQSQYFVLGQAPVGGGTTFRCVTAEGANCNLGPGPEPVLAEFLTAVAAQVG